MTDTNKKADQAIIEGIKSKLTRLRAAQYALEHFSLHDIEAAYIEAQNNRYDLKKVSLLLGVTQTNVKKMIAAHHYLKGQTQ